MNAKLSLIVRMIQSRFYILNNLFILPPEGDFFIPLRCIVAVLKIHKVFNNFTAYRNSQNTDKIFKFIKFYVIFDIGKANNNQYILPFSDRVAHMKHHLNTCDYNFTGVYSDLSRSK